jgi:hypothetical protein
VATTKIPTALIEDNAVDYTKVAAGAVVQVGNSQTGEIVIGNTVIPNDNSIPQSSEGFQVLSLNFTPKSAANKLKIDIVLHLATGTAGALIAALFTDSNTDALAVISDYQATTNASKTLKLTHYMTAGTASQIVFKVRAGCNNAGDVILNGVSAARLFGGRAASSITVTEIKV